MKEVVRVDNVPLYLRPVYLLLSYFLGNSLWLYCNLCSLTVRVRAHNLPTGHCDLQSFLYSRNYIIASWHQFLTVFGAIHLAARQQHPPFTALNHPAWYMKPVHVLLQQLGFRLVLGSTGHGGREAAKQVIQALRSGHSTLIPPDGPKGPARQMKAGALHMSMQSGVPIVPLCYEVSRKWVHSHSWDKKMWLFPFATVDVYCGRPVVVDKHNVEQAKEYVTACMSSPEACMTLHPPTNPSSPTHTTTPSISSSAIRAKL
ncbi:Lysophospholipid acyltransferase family protein [Balamuthia mandrillaris]